jgi:vanillate/4-hydroxybenzoate decarboxylase subunit D
MHLCKTCFFGWRTSEPEAVINPDRYDRRFRLTAEDLAAFGEVPKVPATARQAPRDRRK